MMVTYDFAKKALIVGSLTALCSALLGVSLVLKRYSMIGDGLSHVGFGALCVASVLNLAPLKVAVPVVIVAAFFLLKLSENSKIKGDAAIAMISGTAVAAGLVITSFVDGLSSDVSGYMFGSILSIDDSDVPLSVILSVVVILLYVLFYNRIFSVTFDESFSKAAGIKVDLYNALIALLTAVTIVIGMKLMGTVLISGLIIFPPLSAMRVCKSFKSVTAVSAVISVICFVVGIFLSFVFDTPAGATVVLVNAVTFAVFFAAGKLKKA
ncbi:MAG: metal ABC transporter permease [Clostridia bacterium]|nr:metal ABC transporter permease [Clostridia bacterium]